MDNLAGSVQCLYSEVFFALAVLIKKKPVKRIGQGGLPDGIVAVDSDVAALGIKRK